MKVLVIGSGGREHALCWSLGRGARASSLRIICAPGNAGIADAAECVPLGVTDVRALADFAEREGIDLTIPGGEAPLAAGLADEFTRRGLAVAGPTREAARLESSKAFAKEFMLRHSVPTARHRVASSVEQAREILRGGEFGPEDAPVVVKADGLAAGKGVVVARTRAEAETSLVEMMEGGRVGDAADLVVIEEMLAGREASLLLWTDGRDYRLMPPARDHKRVGERDTGPNTGGMGAVTAPDVLDEETLARVVREIVEPTLEGARADGLNFRGVLFIGLMLTREGPRVLEYNVRFGDPETQAILVRLRSDLSEIFDAVARGRLGELQVEWSDEPSACVVLAARGYPERPETGAVIGGLEAAARVPAVRIFHAGTTRAEDGSLLVAGGRVLGVTATCATLDDALARCYESASHISWDGMHYRRDIGRFENEQ
ncbi:MAG: phosphoribosylamine---glycine ligase [Acidobacteriota bacterium]|nr:phosphoribosylamine---glycine ligase [Acidobacteriota bacterium]